MTLRVLKCTYLRKNKHSSSPFGSAKYHEMSKHEAGTPDNISLGLFNITKNDNNTKEGHLETGRANANISGEDDNGDAKMDLQQEEEKWSLIVWQRHIISHMENMKIIILL